MVSTLIICAGCSLGGVIGAPDIDLLRSAIARCGFQQCGAHWLCETCRPVIQLRTTLGAVTLWLALLGDPAAERANLPLYRLARASAVLTQ